MKNIWWAFIGISNQGQYKIFKTGLTRKSVLQVEYAGVPFWSEKVFEGVLSHVMDLRRKSDFGPLNFSSKFMITCPNPILVHFSIIRIFGFAPISIRSKNLDQNWEFERLKCGPKSDWDT